MYSKTHLILYFLITEATSLKAFLVVYFTEDIGSNCVECLPRQRFKAIGAAEASSMEHFSQSQTPRLLSNHCPATLVTVT
jgi:hypothetical protein